MNTKLLKQKILDLAIRGKLVPQDPNDEPASELLKRIRAEKEKLIAEGKIKRSKKTGDKPHYENGNVPFEIPKSWEWQTLGDIGKWQAGGTPSRGHKEYFGGDIPWLKTGDLNDGYITEIPEFITQAGFENSSAKLNPKDSVLIALYGATIGKVGILTFPATTNQACCACIDHPAVEKLFLYYFLRQHRDEFISQGGGGAQPNISKEIIVATLIPIPPLAEQKRIISGIEKWFDLIDELENAVVDLQDNINQTQNKILDLAIRGKLVPQDSTDEPAIELLKRINPNFTPCDTSHYGNLPKGWAICRLEDIVEYEQPSKYIVESTDYSEEYKTPVLTPGKSFILGYTNETKGIYTNTPTIIFDDFTTDSRYVDFPFKVKSSAMKILQVKKEINIKYVAYFMSITRLVGDTHKRYWISEYSKISIPIPPRKEQDRIVQKIQEIEERIREICAEL